MVHVSSLLQVPKCNRSLLWPSDQRSRSNILRICFTARNISSTYFFFASVLPVCTMIANMIFESKVKDKWAPTRGNLSSEVCEQQRRSPACVSAQSDQRLCYSLFGKYHI